MKNAGWIFFTIALGVIVMMQICTPRKVTVDTRVAQLEQKVKDTARYYQEMLKADSAAINAAEQATADQFEKSEVYRKAANEKQATIDRLVAKVEAAKKEKPDSSWVKVSPKYVDGCDSLANENKNLKIANTQYQEENGEAMKLMLYEIALRDSAYHRQVEFNKKFQSQLGNCMTQLKDKNKSTTRTIVYAEVGLIGNKTNPLSGGSVGGILINKKGQLYGAKGMVVNERFYAELKTGFKLSFR